MPWPPQSVRAFKHKKPQEKRGFACTQLPEEQKKETQKGKERNGKKEAAQKTNWTTKKFKDEAERSRVKARTQTKGFLGFGPRPGPGPGRAKREWFGKQDRLRERNRRHLNVLHVPSPTIVSPATTHLTRRHFF